MFQFVEDYFTRKRVKAFLKRNPIYLLSDEQHERWLFLRNNPGYFGPGKVEPVGEELDMVRRLDPLKTPKEATAFYRQIDKGVDGDGEPWSWKRVRRGKEVKIVDTIETT